VIKEHSNGRARSNGAASTNGVGRYQSEKVRVAIVGVGNCASSFVQGVHYYRDADPTQRVPGLMHVDLGGYHVRDIEFTAAFDIDSTKVGKDLGQAIWAGQNNTIKFAKGKHAVPGKLGVPVYRGMTHDGLGKYLKEKIAKAPGETADIVKILRDTHTDVVVSYLPVGSEDATKWYVEQVLEAGCGFVNCIPVFIAREDYWDKRFKKAGLPIVGDDIKSQVGATIVHRTLARLFAERGVEIERTSQLNVGGNMDFYNMLERERLESKKISKTNAVTSIMDHQLPASDIHVGPSDYVPWLTDRKWAHIRVEGQAFVWRRAAESRAEARGVGLAQLRRHRDRRGALLQARAQPRRQWTARRTVLLPDEVAPQPAPGRAGAHGHGGVHRQVRRLAHPAANAGHERQTRCQQGEEPCQGGEGGAGQSPVREVARHSRTAARTSAGAIIVGRWTRRSP
jgi:myo-inositol-1-phosphate synthase